MTGELAKLSTEVSETAKGFDAKNSFDPDTRADVSYNETGKGKTEAKDFDPDKKADVSYNETREPQSEVKDFAPDKKAEVSEGKKTDDNGVVYSENGELLPNNTYELNGYNYTTDEQGRIVKVEGDIQIPDYKPRSSLPDIPDRRGTDDRGHLVAHEFGGSDTEGNLVPMDSDVNRNGDYRKLENELRQQKEDGHDVSVTIEPQYEGDSKRPTEFVVSYDVDGEHHEKVIQNDPNTSKGA